MKAKENNRKHRMSYAILTALLGAMIFIGCSGNGVTRPDLSLGNGKGNQPGVVVDGFSLTISVENTTVQRDESLRVNVELKNNSGEDHEIAYDWLFRVYTPRSPFPTAPLPFPNVRLFENGSTISQISSVHFNFYITHGILSPGVHQLSFITHFFIGWERPADTDEPISWSITDSAQHIRVVSNIVEITVR